MNIIELLLTELEREAHITRKMLALVPADRLEWAPHQKSMNMKALATHLAELPSWVKMGLTSEELDFATAPYEPAPINATSDLLELFQ